MKVCEPTFMTVGWIPNEKCTKKSKKAAVLPVSMATKAFLEK